MVSSLWRKEESKISWRAVRDLEKEKAKKKITKYLITYFRWMMKMMMIKVQGGLCIPTHTHTHTFNILLSPIFVVKTKSKNFFFFLSLELWYVSIYQLFLLGNFFFVFDWGIYQPFFCLRSSACVWWFCLCKKNFFSFTVQHHLDFFFFFHPCTFPSPRIKKKFCVL